MQRRFPLIRLAFATLRQSTFPRGGRLNRLRTRLPFRGISREIPCERNDDTRTRITDQANDLNALSLWARRGGTKCRKNSPQVTVFSQSGEVAMLRAGQALATWQSPGRENLLAYTDKILARGGFPSKHLPAVALHPKALARGGSPPKDLPAAAPYPKTYPAAAPCPTQTPI